MALPTGTTKTDCGVFDLNGAHIVTKQTIPSEDIIHTSFSEMISRESGIWSADADGMQEKDATIVERRIIRETDRPVSEGEHAEKRDHRLPEWLCEDYVLSTVSEESDDDGSGDAPTLVKR